MANATTNADANVSRTTAVSAIEAAAQQKLHPNKIGFLELPGELKNEIYEMALVRQRKLCIVESSAFGSAMKLNNTRIYTSILRTCKAINHEATPILYGYNHFLFRSSLGALKFLKMIGSSSKFINHFENTDPYNNIPRVDLMAVVPVTKYIDLKSRMCCVSLIVASGLCLIRHGNGNHTALEAIKKQISDCNRYCLTVEGKEKFLELLQYPEDAQEDDGSQSTRPHLSDEIHQPTS